MVKVLSLAAVVLCLWLPALGAEVPPEGRCTKDDSTKSCELRDADQLIQAGVLTKRVSNVQETKDTSANNNTLQQQIYWSSSCCKCAKLLRQYGGCWDPSNSASITSVYDDCRLCKLHQDFGGLVGNCPDDILCQNMQCDDFKGTYVAKNGISNGIRFQISQAGCEGTFHRMSDGEESSLRMVNDVVSFLPIDGIWGDLEDGVITWRKAWTANGVTWEIDFSGTWTNGGARYTVTGTGSTAVIEKRYSSQRRRHRTTTFSGTVNGNRLTVQAFGVSGTVSNDVITWDDGVTWARQASMSAIAANISASKYNDDKALKTVAAKTLEDSVLRKSNEC